MSYELKTYYIDESGRNSENQELFFKERVNKYIEVMGMTGGNWCYQKYEGDVGDGSFVGRYAILEGYPFNFLISYGGAVYVLKSKEQPFLIIGSISGIQIASIGRNAYSFSEVPSEYSNCHYAGMIEIIKDIGGGIHIHPIEKKYNNDKSYSADGNRNESIDIIPIYNLETNELADWAITGGSNNKEYYFYLSKSLTVQRLGHNNVYFGNDGGRNPINPAMPYTPSYPVLEPTQVIYNTCQFYNKYYTIGFGSTWGLYDDNKENRMAYYLSQNIKDKLVVHRAKEEKDLIFVRGFIDVIAYTEEET